MDTFTRRRLPAADPAAATLRAPTSEMLALRPLVREFADEASQLNYELNDEIRRLPTIRPLVTDALKVSALAVGLDKAMERVNDHRVVEADIQELDATWRELAYRLGNVRGLSRPTAERIGSLNQINDDIDNAIGIDPQFKNRELFEKTYDLAQDLRNLIDDVQQEIRGREAQQLLLSLNRARQQVLNIASMLEESRVDSEMIVREYKQFQTLWYPERVKLQQYDNRYLERSLRRITQTDGEIHQLLLLPTKVDSQQLIYLTSALKKDIDEFFDRTSLKLLMHLPRADRVAGVASEFYGVCEHFIDEVNSNAKYDELVDSFRYIEDAQRSFLDVFYDIESDDALAALHQIEQTIEALSASMQVQRDTFDYRAAIELVTRVDTDVEQLEWVAKRWLAEDRQSFGPACLQAIASMRQQTEKLNQELVTGMPSAQLRSRSEQLYDTWRTVYNYLVKCQTADRTNLGRISSRITPALVELRTQLTQ
ncbi:MAG: hypothetical protein SFV23_03215 [Planctomycetaceae bacterium]|nr:hypothetical protein [Planctomycetaceae bacterium]